MSFLASLIPGAIKTISSLAEGKDIGTSLLEGGKTIIGLPTEREMSGQDVLTRAKPDFSKLEVGPQKKVVDSNGKQTMIPTVRTRTVSPQERVISTNIPPEGLAGTPEKMQKVMEKFEVEETPKIPKGRKMKRYKNCLCSQENLMPDEQRVVEKISF